MNPEIQEFKIKNEVLTCKIDSDLKKRIVKAVKLENTTQAHFFRVAIETLLNKVEKTYE